ncbi:hypothetical protein J437_LFUL013013 [Ladona fulva]|uniref:PiggyBac transposable element-derived protein domain-containing protein n=1 Tax=Ladona fulva TaxID=123851 RepID=A0A8K0P9Z3_LADFU|nr:hypothetical protein J437_LFUL013013 [Ladona fulva]
MVEKAGRVTQAKDGKEEPKEVLCYKYFELFFDDDLIKIIVTETNRYAEQFLAHEKETILSLKNLQFHKWVPTTLNEIRVYLGLLMLMGIIQKPSLRMYFSRQHILETPFFPNVMTE